MFVFLIMPLSTKSDNFKTKCKIRKQYKNRGFHIFHLPSLLEYGRHFQRLYNAFYKLMKK